MVTLGGQTPLKLARALERPASRSWARQPDAIDLAEDRERFALLDDLGIMYPPAGMATSFEEAEAVAAQIGYPLLVRPSYVLGGRGMMIAYDAGACASTWPRRTRISPDHPVYLDRFLEGASRSDVDALCDGENVYIGGILEHIEEGGHPFRRLGVRASRPSPSRVRCRKSCATRALALRSLWACAAW